MILLANREIRGVEKKEGKEEGEKEEVTRLLTVSPVSEQTCIYSL